MMCDIASESSWSLELWPEPLAPEVDGRLDARDCVRFANDVIVRRLSYVIRAVTKQIQCYFREALGGKIIRTVSEIGIR